MKTTLPPDKSVSLPNLKCKSLCIRITAEAPEVRIVNENVKLPHDHDVDSAKIVERMPEEEHFRTVAGLMKQLDDPSRLRIFWILCHVEECVIDIAAMTDMSSPAVSHHLRILKTNGLIVSRREGKEMYYKAADTDIAQKLHHAVEEIMEISCPTE